jgi:hypothetical protein
MTRNLQFADRLLSKQTIDFRMLTRHKRSDPRAVIEYNQR